MKVSIVHPLRHHAYYSSKGILDSKNELQCLFGYYNNEDYLDEFVKKTMERDKLLGYKNIYISKNVNVSYLIKMLFLLYKKFPRFENIYFKKFQSFAIKNIKDADCVHVMQDYCNDVIREAKKMGKIIVYEQIQPFDSVQKEILIQEAQKYGYPMNYVEERFSKEKIQKQIENIHMVDYIHVASNTSYNSMVKVFGEEIKHKLIKWPYGSPANIFTPKNEIELLKNKNFDGKIKLLYVGSINLIKGVQYLVEAINKIEKDNIELTIVGKQHRDVDYILIEEIKKSKKINYIESIPHSRMYELYRNHDIFVFPGLCEGFGMVTLEAMTHGLPCIVTDNAEGLVESGKNGLICKSGSCSDIIKAIEYFDYNRSEILRMGLNSIKIANGNTWDKYSNNFKEFYNKIDIVNSKDCNSY